MANGDVYISWKEEAADRGVVGLVHYKPDQLTPTQKGKISAAADGAALVQDANWNEPAGNDFFSKCAIVDPTTEADDEITAVTWEDKANSINYEKFRTLFTSAEKVAIDAQSGLDPADVDQCKSYIEDLKSYSEAGTLNLGRAEVITIVDWFETVGLIGAGRADVVKSGTLPA